MKKTFDHLSGVRSLVRRARTYNNQIGHYRGHQLATDNEYTVQLTNGVLTIPVPAAAAQQTVNCTPHPDVVFEISKTFIYANGNRDAVGTRPGILSLALRRLFGPGRLNT